MKKIVIVAAIVAALAGCGTTSNDELNMLPHANADTTKAEPPEPYILKPIAGDKMCANHGFGPGMIYKAACATGSWGAPSVPEPLP